MGSIEIHILFFIASVLLLVIEVYLGMTTGIFLSGSITLLMLGILKWIGILSEINHYLIVGSITFLMATYFILKFFRNTVKNKQPENDVNDY